MIETLKGNNLKIYRQQKIYYFYEKFYFPRHSLDRHFRSQTVQITQFKAKYNYTKHQFYIQTFLNKEW